MAESTPVTVLFTHTIHAAHPSSWQALSTSPFRLGPLDQQVLPFIPIANLFVFSHPDASTTAPVIDPTRLERAFQLLLDYYPHLTGRLDVDAPDSTPRLHRFGEGARLVLAESSSALSAFTSPSRPSMLDLPDEGNALFPPFDMTAVTTSSLLTIQHTTFACGSVALGVRTLHKVCDAQGFFQLVQDLGELYRGLEGSDEPKLRKEPVVRSYLDEPLSEEERDAARKAASKFFHVPPPAPSPPAAESAPETSPSTPAPPRPPPTVGRILHFSSSSLSSLKFAASHPSSDPTAWISTFSALAAHLYLSLHRARVALHASPSSPFFNTRLDPPDFLTPVNVRSHLSLPARYFPNALQVLHTSSLPDPLTATLWETAQAIQALTRSTSSPSWADELRSSLQWVAALEDKSAFTDGYKYGNNSLMLSQWSKFDAYSTVDFGGEGGERGRPVLSSTPFTDISKIDGLGYVLAAPPGKEGEERGVDLCLALTEPLWEFVDFSASSYLSSLLLS